MNISLHFKRFFVTQFGAISRKIGQMMLVLTLLSVATFLMLELLPGNLADVLLGDNARPEDIVIIQEKLGLDKPLPERFAKWVGGAVKGDLGRSPLTGEGVAESIGHRLPVSIQLMLYAQVIALIIAVPLGVIAGYLEGKLPDRLISSGAFGVLAVPHFVLGILLILLFSIWLRWFPATGYIPITNDLFGSLRSMALPSLTLALVEAPIYLRLLRSDISRTLKNEFVTMARAKGLPEWQILSRHAFRLSSFSLITVMGINVGHLIGGAVIIETLFALPGVGRLLIESIIKRDYLTLQGVVLFIGAAFVLVNLLVDGLYAVLDPRISAHHEK